MRSGQQSSFRNRKPEFLSVVDRLKQTSALGGAGLNGGASTSSGGGGNVTRQAVTQQQRVAYQSEFTKRGAKIGAAIHATSLKLAKLTKLAKRTSVFDDPTVEIQELTAVIKQDITALNSAVVDLQLLCNSQNESGHISKDNTSHSSTVVDTLKTRLMDATKEFKDVLTMRTENMKVHENRRQMYSSTGSKDATNPFVRQRPLAAKATASTTSNAPPPWASSSNSSSHMFPGESEPSSPSQPLIPRLNQQQQMVAVQQDTYMQSRAEALQNVESTIHELGSIFQQLATMVSQQGEIAIRIDENVEDTLANVEGAQGALLKYLNGISSNRWLMIKIFFVLIVFLMIFLFFVA